MKTMKLLRNMDKHTKNGFVSMMCWILFLIVLYGTYSYVQDAPLKGLLDKETGGLNSLAFLWCGHSFGLPSVGIIAATTSKRKKRVAISTPPSATNFLTKHSGTSIFLRLPRCYHVYSSFPYLLTSLQTSAKKSPRGIASTLVC